MNCIVVTTECIYTVGGRGEIGRVYLPSQLGRTVPYTGRDGSYSKRGWECFPALTSLGGFYPHEGMYFMKWTLPLCVLCGGNTCQTRTGCHKQKITNEGRLSQLLPKEIQWLISEQDRQTGLKTSFPSLSAFTLMKECTPESGHCRSVFSEVETHARPEPGCHRQLITNEGRLNQLLPKEIQWLISEQARQIGLKTNHPSIRAFPARKSAFQGWKAGFSSGKATYQRTHSQ